MDTIHLKLIRRGWSYVGVDFSVLRACAPKLQLILHLLATYLLALRVFEPNPFEPYSLLPVAASLCHDLWERLGQDF